MATYIEGITSQPLLQQQQQQQQQTAPTTVMY
jgi:hypothetical protein